MYFLFGGMVLSLIASHLTSAGRMHAAVFFVGGAVLAALSFRLYLASLFVFSLGLVWMSACWLIPSHWGRARGRHRGGRPRGRAGGKAHKPGHHPAHRCSRRVLGCKAGVSSAWAGRPSWQRHVLGHGRRRASSSCAGGLCSSFTSQRLKRAATYKTKWKEVTAYE